MKKNTFDQVKLALMIIAGIYWIAVSNDGESRQIIGMLCYILCAYNWLITEQGQKFIKSLM